MTTPNATTFVLRRADVRTLLCHTALYGLAAIAHDAGLPGIRISWTAGMQPRPCLHGDGIDGEAIGAAVQDHARRHTTADSWVQHDLDLKGTARGLMSPRLGAIGADPATWQRLQTSRHTVLDQLTQQYRWLDLRLLACLGEPCYWSSNRQGQPLQDDGASRLEMQPRNQGSEFVGSRLRKLAATVAARTPQQVADGLTGTTVHDEAGAGKVDSRTATGLAGPGPTDNALAWCALWGLSQFPIAMRVNPGGPAAARAGTAVTSGHLGRTRSEWFHTPVWQHPWRPALLRSILASSHLSVAASAGLPPRWAPTDPALVAARAWLSARGVAGVMRFPIARFGSDSAPERRAMHGEALPVTTR
jgi:CRISPR-associated protein Csb3